MSYEPTNWKAGDIVTSAKLNKMEQGIAASGGIRIVHLTRNENGQSMQLDITPNELTNAFENEEVVIIMANFAGVSQSLIANFYYDETTYNVLINNDTPPFTSSDPDEYFTYDPNSGSSSDTPMT